jgi:hypothetical protein
MRLLLDSHHRDFFSKNGYISFADLFSEETLLRAESIITGNARDLWRTNDVIKSLAFQKNCAEITSELTHTKTVRIAYDQTLCSYALSSFPKTPFSFEDASCVQPIICSMILRLTHGSSLEKTVPFCPCPKERGEALFVSGKMLIILEPLLSLEKQKFLLVAYSSSRPQYIAKEKDPFVNSLKSMGYAFGDHLNVSTHPILFSQR